MVEGKTRGRYIPEVRVLLELMLGRHDLCPSISTAYLSCTAIESCSSHSSITSFSLVFQSNWGNKSLDVNATEVAVKCFRGGDDREERLRAIQESLTLQ